MISKFGPLIFHVFGGVFNQNTQTFSGPALTNLNLYFTDFYFKSSEVHLDVYLHSFLFQMKSNSTQNRCIESLMIFQNVVTGNLYGDLVEFVQATKLNEKGIDEIAYRSHDSKCL